MRDTDSFFVGQLVQVKSREEILATLDERGELNGLPFMPEMLEFCGRQLRVYRQAVKTCDTVNFRGMHRMESAVHLEGARCDGQAHGGCQARCMIFWKHDWITPVPMASDDEAATDPRVDLTGYVLPMATRAQHHDELESSTASADESPVLRNAVASDVNGSLVYRCQATEMPRAAPVRMSWWDPTQYLRDVRAGNTTVRAMMRSVLIMLFNKFQSFDRKFLPGDGLIRGAQHWPFLNGRLTKTPKHSIGLRAGDIVKVKSKDEIVATLNTDRKNRGLSFDAEMVKYCGKEFRVLARVDHIIEEQTGRMINLPNDCVMLEGAICAGEHYQFCPRSIYPYWREIWLELVQRADES